MIRSTIKQVLIGAIAGVVASAALAAESEFSVPAGKLSSAVISYSRQSGEEVIFRADDIQDALTLGVSGRYPHERALEILLANTGFSAHRSETGAIVIVRAKPAAIPALQPTNNIIAMAEPPRANRASVPRSDEPIEEVIVTGNVVSRLDLSDTSESGSRLGLSLKDTPASIEMLGSDVMQARGYQEVSDALSKLPGVTAGDRSSATFWGSFAMRGFERAQLTLLRDGIYLGPATMVMRQQNTFNLDRIEVLRGPSSVLNGNGSIAGAINTVNKSARATDDTRFNALVSYGRYDAYNAGLGVEGPAADNLFYRVDASYFSTGSFVDNSDAYSTNITGSLLWQASDKLSLKLALDYLDDDGPDYFGTPLVPGSVARDPMDVVRTAGGYVIDRAMRFRNYNIQEGTSNAQQTFGRVEMDWQPTGNVSVKNTLYGYKADRHWLNADTAVYCEPALATTFPCIGPEHQGQIQRYYAYFALWHEQEQFGDRFTVNFATPIGDRDVRWVVGGEYSDVDFSRTSGYRVTAPLADGDSVDPWNPTPGNYGPLELVAVAPTGIENRAVFAESMIELLEPLKLVTAARYEELKLDRANVSLRPANYGVTTDRWSRTFKYWSYRAGLVYAVNDAVSLYGQTSNAKDPVGTNLFIATSSQNFELTPAKIWEVGLKATLLDGKAEATLAYYDIKRDDVAETIGRDSASLIGKRTSKGVEVSTRFSPTRSFDLGFAAAYTDALILPSPNAVALANKRPANIPEWTASAYAHYRDLAGLPIDVGLGARYMDERFANHTNTAVLSDYVIVDLSLGWTVNDSMRVSLRSDNVFDEEYIPWSMTGYFGSFAPGGFIYGNELPVGSPRTYSVTLEARF